MKGFLKTILLRKCATTSITKWANDAANCLIADLHNGHQSCSGRVVQLLAATKVAGVMTSEIV